MDDVRVIHGDCLDVLSTLADGSVDCVVTSPPYNTMPTRAKADGNLGMHRSMGVTNAWVAKASDSYSDSMPEDEYQEWLRAVVGECLRVCRGLVWVNHKVRYRDGVAVHPARFLSFPIYAEVIWDRGISMALNCKRFAPSHECLIAFGTPHFWDDAHNAQMSVWRIAPQRSTDHPCPFPLEFARRPIQSSCPRGGTVLDPFAGSGTTGVACLKTGRKCILIEKDARYIPLIHRKLKGAETPLFQGLAVE
jgi:site-specific DNA-methyltransferase (adenine-specific)